MSAMGRVGIMDRLARQELFRPGTFDTALVHNARYDLRVADDLLMIPSQRGPSRQLVKYGSAEHPEPFRGTRIVLHAGETAFLSSVEEFRMPYDVVGILALRPKHARQGIILLSGQVVDPGYGRASGDAWDDGGCNRVFYAVANLGADEVVLTRNEPLLSIVFFSVANAVHGPGDGARSVTTGLAIAETTIHDETYTTTSLSLVTALKHATEEINEVKTEVSHWSKERAQRDALFYLAISLMVGTVFSVGLSTLLGLLTTNTEISSMTTGGGIALAGLFLAVAAVVVLGFEILRRRRT